MGIKYFFSWFKENCSDHVFRLHKHETFADITRTEEECESLTIDNLLIDMNGIFHTCAQKVYEYGNFKPFSRLLGKRKYPESGLKKQLRCFQEVTRTLEKIVSIVQPKKRVIMCVDGPAPMCKQLQQRQRRFVSSTERKGDENAFDSNCLTPGTVFMDYLTKYVDWFIQKKLSEDDSAWSKLDVIFSNEKAPGEGEHKLINYIRKNHYTGDSYCMYGMDADLIMLALGTQIPDFFILREDPMNSEYPHYVVSLDGVADYFTEILQWESKKFVYDHENAINDFIFMCYSLGNDFLPHLPAIEIVENGIETLVVCYRKTGAKYGHLTHKGKDGVVMNLKALENFMENISELEQEILQHKLTHKDKFFPDQLLEKHSKMNGDGTYDIDMKAYRLEYYKKNFPMKITLKSLERVCHEYLDGLQWVLAYYTKGVPNWRWKYPFYYAPFANTLSKFIETYKPKKNTCSAPISPFVQLLSVLPPASSNLLPDPLNILVTCDENSPLGKFYPEKFDVDVAGKKQQWEGIALLPMIEYGAVEDEFEKLSSHIHPKDLKRNILGRSWFYTNTGNKEFFFRSFYGDFPCKVEKFVIDM